MIINLLMVSYDICNLKSYPKIYRVLKLMKAERLQQSLYQVETHLTKDQLYDILKSCLSENDKLRVFEYIADLA